MSMFGGGRAFFGLDIGSTGLRAVELKGTANARSLFKYAYAPIDSKLSLSDSKNDQQHLTAAVRQLVEQARFSTRDVVVGIPSQRVFTTVADIDRLSPRELEKSIRYQADALIPTPLNESKIDWATLGESPVDKTKIEILLTSVPNDFIERRLDIIEAAGLNVTAFEPDNLALVRALTPAGVKGAVVILDIGYKSTDIAIVYNGLPRLTRSVPTGMEALLRSAMQNLNVDEKQAEQFVMKFGLSREKLEGQVFQAITSTVELLTSEVEKSIKFFKTRYTTAELERIIVTGGGASLPEFPLYMANKFSLTVEIGNPWQRIQYGADRQNELSAIASQFGVAAGLAERDAA